MEYTIEEKNANIKNALLTIKDNDPIKIIKQLMKNSYINIHGPEHHFLDGATLMVAMHNSGLKFDLENSLDILASRTIKMPGAMCGYWGICGSIASIGAVFSIIDGTSPLSNDESYASHMKFTSNVINIMSTIGGPRCCKRNAFISIKEGIKYANKKYNLNIKEYKFKCEFSALNNQCIKNRCPFHN